MKKAILNKLFVLMLISALSFTANAQDQMSESENTELNSTENNEIKQYKRFKLYIDTVTNLVTYTSMVDQVDTEADSLYVRLKKWANLKYDLTKNKKSILLDKPNEKIVLKGKFDAYTATNKYNKTSIGDIHYTLTIILKENRYKYIIDNISYVPYQDPETIKNLPPNQYEGKAEFEYLLSKQHKVKDTDNLLKCTDEEFKALISEIKKALKNPIQLDEDDF